MPVKLENVGIAVRDLDAAIAFFTDLGLTVLGRARISGEWADTAVGLDGNTADIAVLQTPDGNGRIEMFQYVHPDAIEVEPVQPNTIGMHRVSFKVDNIDAALEIAARHGCHPLRGVATYEDVYKLTYLRGPSGILVMFAEELKKEDLPRSPLGDTPSLVRLELDDLGRQGRPGSTVGPTTCDRSVGLPDDQPQGKPLAHLDFEPGSLSASHTIHGHSVVLRLKFGNVRILFAGDLNNAAEEALLAEHAAGRIDLES